MKKRILILTIINIIVLFIVYIIQPHCSPCFEGIECPLCYGKEQVIVLISLIIFNVFYIIKYVKRKTFK